VSTRGVWGEGGDDDDDILTTEWKEMCSNVVAVGSEV
jgi:hypothetical protein